MRQITFHLGQVVAWPASPCGFAQISDLRRRKVELVYPYKNGRIARPVVAVVVLSDLQQKHPHLLIGTKNLFARGYLPKSKTYNLEDLNA